MPTSFCVGQAIIGKIQFPDGEFPKYDRPYLIVGVDGEYIEVLTVSTVKGKEWKLAFPENREIINHDPPFPKSSFVKLDSLQRVHISRLSKVWLSRNGKPLEQAELSKIINAIKK